MSKEKVYSEAEISEKLAAELPKWEFKEGVIRRTYKTAGWPWTMMLVNAIGFVAEAAFHHPDLSVSWAMVTVKLSTHTAKGVTDKDFELAREIDRVALWQPGEGAALEGFEKGFKKKWVH